MAWIKPILVDSLTAAALGLTAVGASSGSSSAFFDLPGALAFFATGAGTSEGSP